MAELLDSVVSPPVPAERTVFTSTCNVCIYVCMYVFMSHTVL